MRPLCKHNNKSKNKKKVLNNDQLAKLKSKCYNNNFLSIRLVAKDLEKSMTAVVSYLCFQIES